MNAVTASKRGLPRLRFRARVLGFSTILVALAIIGSLVVDRAIRLQRLDREIAAALAQERQELELLASGRDPETGQPFQGDVARIFDTFLRRNVPSEGEVYITFVNDELYKTTPSQVDLGGRRELVRQWLSSTSGARDEIDTPAGPVRYLVVPIQQRDDRRGVFVVAFFIQDLLDEINSGTQVAAATSGVMLLVATGAGWLIAGRLLRPVRNLTERARTITETDLTGRIAVEGDDEIAELARTFNEMLDRLSDAFEMQRRFVADAGHELRTPITIVRGHLELMGDEPQERAETVALVTDELDRMARIVEDLLLLAKAEQPDFVQPEPVELTDLTTELLVKARALGEREWRLGGCGEGTVAVDAQRLTQATLNLARNAVEHTSPGAMIEIGSARTGDEARLWVRDAGSGIDAADRDRIFDRFARGGTRTRRSEGAGLGLAIARAIAEAHGGRIELRTEVGEGSTFTIAVPDVIRRQQRSDRPTERTGSWRES